ncbi:bifunctional protein-disulfide isomerase/oxidoreductase DsbC [Avibacterium paragallinarum]|uniref:Thiol:disulfide interchange protein n=1 Tax=Avibacterium paragallinarum TaxID=728 RepID=A0A0F5EYC7_AVIPA|nr:bifunctional protein-disulfide isomerase/oxidoreductase DsbC [Avibacterium paragallinarum]KAA6209203.1 bifunctional protein-disulfide isomerase/oxidoreductase DsbC [Avibacterium paragallinarum]KKB01390.1 protein-disulfide isomerase [Avibacterium paragallinarum]RZN56933.1 bifunctional protein-disulfide isomerase/oxidoreductase DsbC [Avibacterium paragallinarum]RZN58961.1 bifunctional protein-disulfide isomerase/oxidoreductase DsbC [Avibacterium paragallinarum]RZN71956.1 bifunctional protein-
MKKIITALSLAALSVYAVASDAQIETQLKKLGVSQMEIKSSPINGLKTVISNEGIFYASEDGKYVLQGQLYELTDKGAVDLTGKFLLDKLNSYKNEMIVYPAKNEKYVVTVFMDITCHYCHLLHQQLSQYNDLGITVRYLAFPRGGLNNNTAKQMEAIWQAKDPAQALNEAEKGNPPKTLKNADIVKKHYELGVQFGVRGTPSIVTPKGELIGGYLPPKELLQALQEE